MTRFFALVALCCAGAIGLQGQSPSQDIIVGECTLAGTWTQNSEGLGSSTWTITADGEATESGLGNAKGRATLSGRKVRIDWTIPGYNNSGYYEWNLDAACQSGSGVAVNTVSGVTRKTTVAKTAGPPGEAATIKAEIRDLPTEVWVGWGRPSMSATIFITGFRRNTADPVVLECPDAISLQGDHPDPGGDAFRRVRVWPCGATAQTYDWPVEGYGWGILISAPEKDGGPQPGRPRDICIGSNPVRLRVSQKGAGSATLTIAPQLLLKAGLVGGGGTYGPTNCTGDARGPGGGGTGGGGTGPFRCGLGILWKEAESGWTGTWRRRGDSNVFDARWERAGFRPIEQILTMTLSGNTVTIFRQDPNVAGNNCTYQGTVGSDGVTVTGEYTCNDRGNRIGPVPWTATIICDTGSSTALAGKFAIATANGSYLTAVNGGGVGGPNAVHTQPFPPGTVVSGFKETFTLLPQPDGKYAIQTYRGTYLTAVRGGGLSGPDTIHTDATRIDAWEKFAIERQADGTYAIRTVNGNYLTAVNGGGIGEGRGAIHTNATTVSGWEKFKLVSTDWNRVAVDHDSSTGLKLPRTLQECETSSATICGSWTLNGNFFEARWSNGATATLTIERFDGGAIIINRRDRNVDFSARYVGRLSGNKIEGTVTWSSGGRSWSGTWNASW